MFDISYLARCFGTFIPQGECRECVLAAECEEVTDTYRQAELALKEANDEKERILMEVREWTK